MLKYSGMCLPDCLKNQTGTFLEVLLKTLTYRLMHNNLYLIYLKIINCCCSTSNEGE
jgi:hypothetical protein